MRWVVVGLAVVALAAGCSGGPVATVEVVATPSASAPADPVVTLLLEAEAKVHAGTFRQVIATVLTTSNDVTTIVTITDMDPTNRRLRQVMTESSEGELDPTEQMIQEFLKGRGVPEILEYRYVGDNCYYGPPAGKSWTGIEMSRLRATSMLRTEYESGRLFQPKVLAGLRSAVRDPDGGYSGEVDLAVAAQAPVNQGRRDVLQAQLASTNPRRQITVTLDDQGRLAGVHYLSHVIVVDEWWKSDVTITYSRWGEPVSVEAPPADEVTDAPAEVYERW